MDFSLSDDQLMLQQNARQFFTAQGGTQPARRAMEGDVASTRALWKQMAELGYPAITIAEAYGGAGEGFLSLVPVLEEAGRVLTPGPLAETVGFAVPLLTRLGTQAQKQRYLQGIADGAEIVTLAFYESSCDPFAGQATVTAERTAAGFRLNGQKVLVPNADLATALIVLARTTAGPAGEGLSLFIVDPKASGIQIRLQRPMDQTRPLFAVSFEQTEIGEEALIGPLDEGWTAAEEALRTLAVSLSVLSVGGMDACVEQSAEYAKTRVQFGQPIGRFQAVKHRIVDMKVDLETARSLTYYAAWALEEGSSDRYVAAADAKSFTAQAFVRVANANIQNHGGMGFTWEAEPHLYAKRAKAWENYIGSPEAHLDYIAAAQGW